MSENSAGKSRMYRARKKTIGNLLIFSVLAIVVLSISFVSAAGVSTPYWSTNPLKLQPGESTIVTLGLQNMVGSDDITLRASIAKGGDIAAIIDEDLDYFVPIGSEDVTVNIKVKIPQSAEIGKTQEIEVSFIQVASGEGEGFFSLASAFTQRIPVLVVGEPTESAIYQPAKQTGSQMNTLLSVALAVIILILVIFFVLRKRKI
ncbi:MAG: LPXTG cell wall anchor domain-containing protein [Nanoarchaeota archaeon]